MGVCGSAPSLSGDEASGDELDRKAKGKDDHGGNKPGSPRSKDRRKSGPAFSNPVGSDEDDDDGGGSGGDGDRRDGDRDGKDDNVNSKKKSGSGGSDARERDYSPVSVTDAVESGVDPLRNQEQIQQIYRSDALRRAHILTPNEVHKLLKAFYASTCNSAASASRSSSSNNTNSIDYDPAKDPFKAISASKVQSQVTKFHNNSKKLLK
jgi:hypothetical protein